MPVTHLYLKLSFFLRYFGAFLTLFDRTVEDRQEVIGKSRAGTQIRVTQSSVALLLRQATPFVKHNVSVGVVVWTPIYTRFLETS